MPSGILEPACVVSLIKLRGPLRVAAVCGLTLESLHDLILNP